MSAHKQLKPALQRKGSMRSVASMHGAGGIAIIFALMVISVVSAIAVKQSWRSELDIARAGHRWMGMQAKAYSEGAESLAVIALEKDLANSKIDSASELWASGFDFPTDHGAMRILIVDAQSRLNLNGLGAAYNPPPTGNAGSVSTTQKYKSEHLRFIRLLQTIPLDENGNVLPPTEAVSVLEAVKDWVDVDSTATGFGGAERGYYEQLDPPITIANSPMVSVSELRYVKGMTPELYQGILPFVAALPVDALLNVNTMNVWLARTINSDDDIAPLSEQDAQQLMSEIMSNEPEDTQMLLAIPLLDTLFSAGANGQSNLATDGLAFASGWFELDTTVTVGDHVRRSKSLIDRTTAGSVKVVRRSDANF